MIPLKFKNCVTFCVKHCQEEFQESSQEGRGGSGLGLSGSGLDKGLDKLDADARLAFPTRIVPVCFNIPFQISDFRF